MRLGLGLLLLTATLAATPLGALAQAGVPLGGSTPVEQPQATPPNQSPVGQPQPSAQTTPVPFTPLGPVAPPNPFRVAPTPVGSVMPVEKPEPLSLFVYLLIILAGLWFVAAILGIARLLRGPYRQQMPMVTLPTNEQDRPFLSFAMPFVSLVSVGIIVAVLGILFLALARVNRLYTLAVDLLIVCLVMLVATTLAWRASRSGRTAVE